MHAITHTNEPRANERALVVSESSVYSVSYQKITRQEKKGEKEGIFGREKKSVRERAKGAYSS